MARVTSPYPFTGTIDGHCFYTSNGELFIKKVHRHKRDTILHGKAFENTRLINKEFAACARLAKTCAASFAPDFLYMKPWHLVGMITGMLKKIQGSAPGAKGFRAMLPCVHGKTIQGKEFNKSFLFSDVCRFDFNNVFLKQDNSFVLSTSPFLPAQNLVLPSGATYFRLVVIAFAVPSLCYDADKNDFYVTSDFPAPAAVWSYSPFVPVGVVKPISLQVQLNLGTVSNKPDGTAWIVCTGLEFYKGAINTLSLLDGRQCLRVIEVV